jgi:hypothetical protein
VFCGAYGFTDKLSKRSFIVYWGILESLDVVIGGFTHNWYLDEGRQPFRLFSCIYPSDEPIADGADLMNQMESSDGSPGILGYFQWPMLDPDRAMRIRQSRYNDSILWESTSSPVDVHVNIEVVHFLDRRLFKLDVDLRSGTTCTK